MNYRHYFNAFAKSKAGRPFLFFGQICRKLIKRASQFFILAVSFSEERAEVCTCQDPENGYKSNDCPIHHWKYDNSLFKQT
jgi:hypothetical protein